MMGCCSALRREFQWKNLGFSGVKAERFFSFQWRAPTWLYMLYRLALMTYALFWLLYYSLRHGTPPQAWGAYLTNWTYTVLSLYLTAHFFAALYHHFFAALYHHRRHATSCCARPAAHDHAAIFEEIGTHPGYSEIPGGGGGERGGGEGDSSYREELNSESAESGLLSGAGGVSLVGGTVSLLPRPPWYACVVWVLFDVVSSAACMVTVVFFAFLYRQLSIYPHIDNENMQVHALNSVIVMAEHCLTGLPFRLLHVLFPFVYGLVYMTFSLVYWAGDHSRVMYPHILDWNHAGETVAYVLFIGFFIVPFFHTFFFGVYKARMALWCRL